MLNEKLMEALDNIQSSLCLESEKKLAYAYADGYGISGCTDCNRDVSCVNTCQDACARLW
jgi:hypothetical protein